MGMLPKNNNESSVLHLLATSGSIVLPALLPLMFLIRLGNVPFGNTGNMFLLYIFYYIYITLCNYSYIGITLSFHSSGKGAKVLPIDISGIIAKAYLATFGVATMLLAVAKLPTLLALTTKTHMAT